MSWLTRLLGIESPPPSAPTEAATPPTPSRRAPALSPGAVAGGRVSTNRDGRAWLGNSWVINPPESYEDEWRLGNFDANTLSKVSPQRLVEMLSDLSPEVSRGLWDFQRMVNPGYEIKARRPGGKTEFPRAQKALDAFVKTLHHRHGTFDVVIGRLSMGAFWRGAILPELVLDAAARMPLDIATPDPMFFRFREYDDPVLGTQWELGQWQDGEWVSLDIPTISYVPVDPALNSPYGRPMVSPALFTSLFLLAILHDLRRVVQQQGYPRLDISVDLEKLTSYMPDSAIGDPAKEQAWANSLITMVMAAYHKLQPDDAYVHDASITVNKPVGAVDSSSLGAVDALIKTCERMAMRALKTMPLMMGLDQSTNETDSNRQWEIHVAGIKSIQHYIETAMGRMFTLALEAQGFQAEVEFKLAELRAAEELRDEQTRTMRINNTRAEYDNGWIGQDEAAQKVVGHMPDQPAPRTSGGGNGLEIVQDDGDGQERADRVRVAAVIERMAAWIERQEQLEAKRAEYVESVLRDAEARVNGRH